jgi:hypothetical protein
MFVIIGSPLSGGLSAWPSASSGLFCYQEGAPAASVRMPLSSMSSILRTQNLQRRLSGFAERGGEPDIIVPLTRPTGFTG